MRQQIVATDWLQRVQLYIRASWRGKTYHFRYKCSIFHRGKVCSATFDHIETKTRPQEFCGRDDRVFYMYHPNESFYTLLLQPYISLNLASTGLLDHWFHCRGLQHSTGLGHRIGVHSSLVHLD